MDTEQFDGGAVALSTPLLQKNRLLAALSTSARLRLLPHVDLVQMRAGQSLDAPVGGVRRAYFPVTAMAALFRELPGGASTQVAMVGNEGMVGVCLVTQGDPLPLRSVLHSSGAVLAVDGARLLQEFQRGGTTMRVLLRYTYALMMQMSQMALCNRHHSIEQQLARWLLMTADRLGTRDIETTQERIAALLGVRREGVTEAAGRLRDAGIIACRRGRVIVLDASALSARSCECYGVLKAEYEQVLRPSAHGIPTARRDEADAGLPLGTRAIDLVS